MLAQSRIGPGAWIDEVDVLSFEPRAYQPAVSIGPTGETLVVWNQWTGTGYGVLLASRPALDGPWERPEDGADALSPRILNSNAPRIAHGRQGEGLLTWYQSIGGPLMVFASERVAPSGEFSRPNADEFLSHSAGPVDSHPVANPRPAYGPAGEAAVVWTQEDGQTRATPGGATPVYVALRDARGRWQRPTDQGESLSRAGNVARCPRLAFSDAGILVVVWQEDDGPARSVVSARRVSGEWSLERLSPEGSTAVSPVIAAWQDEVVAAWFEERAGHPMIVARRMAPDGGGWGAPVRLSPVGEEPSSPAIAAAAGRFLVAWPQGGVRVASLQRSCEP